MSCEAKPAHYNGVLAKNWLYCSKCKQSLFDNWRPWKCSEKPLEDK